QQWASQGRPWPGHTRVAAVGEATAQALRDSGRVPAECILVPDSSATHDSESLWRVLKPHIDSFSKVLLLRGQNGREWLGQQLEQAGASVTRYGVYQRRAAHWNGTELQQLQQGLASGQALVCLLTSTHAVESFVDNAKRLGLLSFCPQMHYVVIHARIAARLQSLMDASWGTSSKWADTIRAPSVEALYKAVTSLASLREKAKGYNFAMTDKRSENTSGSDNASQKNTNAQKPSTAPAAARSGKKPRRGLLITVLVLLVVIAGLGGTVWYQHKTMHESLQLQASQASESVQAAQAA